MFGNAQLLLWRQKFSIALCGTTQQPVSKYTFSPRDRADNSQAMYVWHHQNCLKFMCENDFKHQWFIDTKTQLHAPSLLGVTSNIKPRHMLLISLWHSSFFWLITRGGCFNDAVVQTFCVRRAWTTWFATWRRHEKDNHDLKNFGHYFQSRTLRLCVEMQRGCTATEDKLQKRGFTGVDGAVRTSWHRVASAGCNHTDAVSLHTKHARG